MADLVKITTHVADAQARLVEQFKEQPRLLALIEAWVEPLQDIEEQLSLLLHYRTLDASVGQQLDNLGAIVGQAREGRTDDEYRLWIAARRLVNIATGIPNDFLHLMETVLPMSESEYIPYYPAGFQIRSYGLDGGSATIWQILSTIKPAGVHFGFQYSDVPADEVFTLSDSGSLTASSTLGLGDSTDASVGGKFAGVYVA